MKKIILLLLFAYINISAQDITHFNTYFEDATMRIDYYHIGDNKSELFTIDRIYKQGMWAGSRINLIDNFNNGAYYYKIFDEASGELIYSKGFDSFFKEYQTSEEALKGINRTYHESALIPYPKDRIKLSVLKRDNNNILNEIYSVPIDPTNVMIVKDKVVNENVTVTKSLFNGDPHKKVDIVIVAEGYTESEREKYYKDLNYFTDILIKYAPYKRLKDNFNVYGVFMPSQESGVDEPRANIFKNSVLSATFNTFGSERYLLSEDNKTLRNLASHVPYDAIYIMVNHKRYGGGGIYNWSCTFTTDNQFNEYLFVHEFGHSFAGLADEYYTSDVGYSDFYKPTLEPVEPNVTALLDPGTIKWKDLVSDGIQIPTPWEKETFDSTDYAWQKLRREMNNRTAELKRENASLELIKEAENDYAEKDKLRSIEVDEYLESSKFFGKVGAFEGAGYVQKGLYRPMIDCIMFSKGQKPFCKVCEDAITKVIHHYGE